MIKSRKLSNGGKVQRLFFKLEISRPVYIALAVILGSIAIQIFNRRHQEISEAFGFLGVKLLEQIGVSALCQNNSSAQICILSSYSDIGWLLGFILSACLFAFFIFLSLQVRGVYFKFATSKASAQVPKNGLETWQLEARRARSRAGRLVSAIAISVFAYGVIIAQQTFNGRLVLLDSFINISPSPSNRSGAPSIAPESRRDSDTDFGTSVIFDNDNEALIQRDFLPQEERELIGPPNTISRADFFELAMVRFAAFVAGIIFFGTAYSSYLRAERRSDEIDLFILANELQQQGIEPKQLAELRAAAHIDFDKAFRHMSRLDRDIFTSYLPIFQNRKSEGSKNEKSE
jgi:hypothetical protein